MRLVPNPKAVFEVFTPGSQTRGDRLATRPGEVGLVVIVVMQFVGRLFPPVKGAVPPLEKVYIAVYAICWILLSASQLYVDVMMVGRQSNHTLFRFARLGREPRHAVYVPTMFHTYDSLSAIRLADWPPRTIAD